MPALTICYRGGYRGGKGGTGERRGGGSRSASATNLPHGNQTTHQALWACLLPRQSNHPSGLVGLSAAKAAGPTTKGNQETKPRPYCGTAVAWLQHCGTAVAWQQHCGMAVAWQQHCGSSTVAAALWQQHCGTAIAWQQHCGMALAWQQHCGTAVAWQQHCGTAVAWQQHCGTAVAWQ